MKSTVPLCKKSEKNCTIKSEKYCILCAKFFTFLFIFSKKFNVLQHFLSDYPMAQILLLCIVSLQIERRMFV